MGLQISKACLSWWKEILSVPLGGHLACVELFMVDVVEEVMDLTRAVDATFYHAKRRANSEADCLAKERVIYQSVLMGHYLTSLCFFLVCCCFQYISIVLISPL